MTDTQLKPPLRRTVEAAQQRERFLVDRCDDAPPVVENRWTAKDHVAHLSAWREHAAEVLHAARSGQAAVEDFDIDTRNASIHAQNRARSAREVLSAAQRSSDALLAAIDACSEADLQRERCGRAGRVWQVVPGNGHLHVGQHVIQWQLEEDDEAGAEQTARWIYDLDMLFTDPQSQATAKYNLGCFYARAGRAEEAIALLRESLEGGGAALKEWARDDADLSGIRDRPEVHALLDA